MIKRFHEIKGVGCFVNDRPAPLEFKQLTFVYGENCYGKSTLCDIIRSLVENNSDYITNRMSVPNPQNHTQHVKLNISLPGQDREENFIFHNNKWNLALPPNLRVFVFDTEFIHRNVFAGLTIERKNQEQLTQFVLGETSVQTAKEIESFNSSLRNLNKKIREQLATSFEGIVDVSKFIELKIHESEEEIQKEIQSTSVQLERKRKLYSEIDEVINREEPNLIYYLKNFKQLSDSINQTLKSTFQEAHHETTKRVNAHISQNTQAHTTTQTWIHQGLGHIKGNNCPFCGQTFDQQATELLKIYNTYFDDEFNRFILKTRSDLEQLQNDYNRFNFTDILITIHQNENFLSKYTDLNEQANFQQLITTIQHNKRELEEKIQLWGSVFQESAALLSLMIEEKKGAIYSDVGHWDNRQALIVYDDLCKLVEEYNNTIQALLEYIHDFKKKLHAPMMAAETKALEEQRNRLNLKQRRLNSNNACEIYTKLSLEKQTIESELKILENKLKNDQTKFLNDYFEAINKIFKKLGSRNFNISKQLNMRGNMPTIQLLASFADAEITPGKLQSFFSESDRRALALSVFLAKIDLLSTEEKRQTILVFDDPVTSFDEGRIERTIELMESLRKEMDQIIILSHYPRYLNKFFIHSYAQTTDIQLFGITKDQQGSHLEEADTAEFVESPHQKKFRRIIDFIERKHKEDICPDLRVYLECEVKSRFYEQIDKFGLNKHSFKKLIDELHEHGVIDDDTKVKLHFYRDSLNPDHHIWTDRPHDEKIGLATDVIDLIYYGL